MKTYQITISETEVERWNMIASLQDLLTILRSDNYLDYFNNALFDIKDALFRYEKLIKVIEKAKEQEKIENNKSMPDNLNVIKFEFE